MIWKGIELVEITETGNIVFPKKMVVWDNIGLGSSHPCVREVLAIVKDNVGITRVIASQLDKDSAGVAIWNHCTEIPEEPKPRRATHREVSKWLAQGNGEVTSGNVNSSPYCKTSIYYNTKEANDPCGDEITVRKWDDTDWHEPDVQYMGLEE